jgi:hypothetical protein
MNDMHPITPPREEQRRFKMADVDSCSSSNFPTSKEGSKKPKQRGDDDTITPHTSADQYEMYQMMMMHSIPP